jgi:hypothetical protein
MLQLAHDMRHVRVLGRLSEGWCSHRMRGGRGWTLTECRGLCAVEACGFMERIRALLKTATALHADDAPPAPAAAPA